MSIIACRKKMTYEKEKNTKNPLYLSLIELKNSLQVNSLSSLLTEDSLPYSFSDGMPCDLTIPFSHFSRPNYFLRIRKRNRISFMNEKKLNRIKRRWERCVWGDRLGSGPGFELGYTQGNT